MRSRYIGILLFLCFVVPVATTFLSLHLQRRQAKFEAKSKIDQGINAHDIVLLKFTEDQKNTLPRWEHDREFEYDGQMYDILKIEVKNDTNYYWCYWDKEETKIKQQQNEMQHFVLGNNPHKQDNQKRLFVYFNSLFFVDLIPFHHFSQPQVDFDCVYKSPCYNYLLTLVSTPPPERA